MDIKNRIVEIRKIRLGDVQPNERNPRTHPEDQKIAYRGVLNAIGWAGVPLAYNSERQGGLTFLDGHMRQIETPDLEAEIAITDLTDDDADLFMLTYDPISALAEMDIDLTADILADLDQADMELIDSVLDVSDYIEEEPPPDPGPQVDRAEELRVKWGVESGQLWQLGDHRLICGDCTDSEVVERVMGGERAQSVIVDPPFAVRDDEWDQFDDFELFTKKWLSIGNQHSDVIISFMADRNVPQLLEAAVKAGLEYRRALIWRKPPGSQFAGASLDGYWFDFEIIQVFGKPTFTPSKMTKMAVLEHRTITGQEHGCEKPVQLIEDLLIGYVQQEKLMVDLFSGTGTGITACERLNRKCRAVEISPAYCAVAIERWHEMTEQEPVLIDGG